MELPTDPASINELEQLITDEATARQRWQQAIDALEAWMTRQQATHGAPPASPEVERRALNLLQVDRNRGRC